MSTLDEQLEQFRKQIGDDPKDFLAHYNFGVTLMKLGRVDEGLAAYKKSIEFDIDRHYSAFPHFNLGSVYYKKKELNEAVIEFEKAIHDLSTLKAEGATKTDIAISAHYTLGLALFERTQQREHYGGELADLEKAKKSFEGVLEFDPNNSGAQKKVEILEEMLEHGWTVDDKKTGDVIKFFAGKNGSD